MHFNDALQVDRFSSWLKLAFHLFYDQQVEIDRLVDLKKFPAVSWNESVVVYWQHKLSFGRILKVNFVAW